MDNEARRRDVLRRLARGPMTASDYRQRAGVFVEGAPPTGAAFHWLLVRGLVTRESGTGVYSITDAGRAALAVPDAADGGEAA